jgi:transcriptional regulator with XRE-family HTH domain
VKQKPAPQNVLGPALRNARAARGWTLKRMAEALRSEGFVCSTARLGKIEAQEAAIKDFEVLYFCAALDMTQEELWKRRT